jgi:nucleotide-binding universal stress UspA family protein
MAFLQKILCPVDFSDSAKIALNHALGLAKRVGGSVEIVHICDVPYHLRPDLSVWLDDSGHPLEEQVRNSAEARMQELVASLDPELLSRVHAEVHFGDPATAIADLAEQKGVDLIAMGTHGRTGLQHLIMGSVAEKVVRRALCPVLVVREGGRSETLLGHSQSDKRTSP